MQHTVRYFVIDFDTEDNGCFDTMEVSEREFMAAEGGITYERHTMIENGCSQICLTKGLDV